MTTVEAEGMTIEFDPRKLVSYNYVGSQAVATTELSSTGTMPVRDDMRRGKGLIAAPFGILLLGAAGINVDAMRVQAPTQIDLHFLDDGVGVRRVRIENRVLRAGTTQMFTDGVITDADDPERVIAIGNTSWACVGPKPEDFNYFDPGPGAEDDGSLPSIFEVFEGRTRPDGRFEIPGLSAKVGSGGSLHQGPIQLLNEWAAVDAAEKAAGTDALVVEAFGTTVIAPARQGPFVATSEVVANGKGTVAVRTTVIDVGLGDRPTSHGFGRYRIA